MNNKQDKLWIIEKYWIDGDGNKNRGYIGNDIFQGLSYRAKNVNHQLRFLNKMPQIFLSRDKARKYLKIYNSDKFYDIETFKISKFVREDSLVIF